MTLHEQCLAVVRLATVDREREVRQPQERRLLRLGDYVLAVDEYKGDLVERLAPDARLHLIVQVERGIDLSIDTYVVDTLGHVLMRIA